MKYIRLPSRTDWDTFYMDLAARVAMQSYCHRYRVGAVITDKNHIISYGFNGTPSGDLNICEDDEGNTLPTVIHAEKNAIAKAASSTISTKGSTLYVTRTPCVDCATLIISAGILNVVYIPQGNLDGINKVLKGKVNLIEMIDYKTPFYLKGLNMEQQENTLSNSHLEEFPESMPNCPSCEGYMPPIYKAENWQLSGWYCEKCKIFKAK